MVSTPFVPVPPPRYGGTELIVAALVEGLAGAGHELTLFSCGGSSAPCEVRALYDAPRWPPCPYVEADHAGWAIREILAEERPYDLVHAHVPSVLPWAPLIDAPLVYTVHHAREDCPSLLPAYRRARAQFVAVSRRQRELLPEVDRAAVIHHGVEPSGYRLGDGRGGYAAFLGRLSRVKGVHRAIDVARAAGVPIRIAGKPHDEDDYFAACVRPRLGRLGVELLGEVGGPGKVAFLGDAAALLFPIDWEEPFGLVMIEAMLCGTPVLALPRGSVPEIVEDGVTGFVCRDTAEMTSRLRAIARGAFDRRRCRERALARWSAARMVEDHLRLYGALVAWEGMDGRGRLAAAPAT